MIYEPKILKYKAQERNSPLLLGPHIFRMQANTAGHQNFHRKKGLEAPQSLRT